MSIATLPIPGVVGTCLTKELYKGDIVLTPYGKAQISRVIPLGFPAKKYRLFIDLQTPGKQIRLLTTPNSLWYLIKALP